jgi:hypothetical protein
MSAYSQLFKYKPPLTILYDFLKKVCLPPDTTPFYLFNKITFKQSEFKQLIFPFTETLKSYYFLSKQYYAERKMTYKNFITLLRHLCNEHQIQYKIKLIYDKSSYEIHYYISKTFMVINENNTFESVENNNTTTNDNDEDNDDE